MNEFITIATYNYPHEVEILKHRLNMANITYYFENETTLSVAPMYSIALGGIKLRVHRHDAESARKILDELDDKSNLRIV